jgi:hypothetical protein
MAPKTLLSAGLILVPALSFAESQSLTQLRMAAAASESAAYAPTMEGAASANQVWSENGGIAESGTAVKGSYSKGSAAAPVASRPNLTAKDLPAVPDAEPADPVPPKIKGWTGFKLGFLGMEAQGLRWLSPTGKLGVPLFILLQPILLPVSLVVGLLGIFGIRV